MSAATPPASPTDAFSLEQLCALTGLPSRTVRYYIQTGLVPRPVGDRRNAFYTREHAEKLLAIRRWQADGLSLDRIRELLSPGHFTQPPPPRPRQPGSAEVWSHVYLNDGLEVVIEPGRAELAPEELRDFLTLVRQAYDLLKRNKKP